MPTQFFDLDMLHIHNFIEHDGSLSRKDSVFDKTNQFSAEILDSFLSYFGNATTMDIASTANARARHALDMAKVNPNFSTTQDQLKTILGENALMLAIWRNGTEGSGTHDEPIATREFYEFFFRRLRMPSPSLIIRWY